MRIVLLHYSYAPVVGGVEEVMAQHARLLRSRGHEVTILCGMGEGEGVVNSPELAMGGSAEIFAGRLSALVAGKDLLCIHNVMHMPFRPEITSALWELAGRLGVRMVSWIHDLAAINPDYELGDLSRGPLHLLTRAHPMIEYVAVSPWRRRQFLELTGADACEVIPNGIDPVEFLRLSAPVAALAKRERLFERDLVIFQPARLVRRKNVEAGIRLTAELRTRGRDVVLLVTAAVDPHNESCAEYARELDDLAVGLGVRDRVIRVFQLFPVTRSDLISLYELAHMVFYPSEQEGFGLPLLEAGVARVPMLAARANEREWMWPEIPCLPANASVAAMADAAESLVNESREMRVRSAVLPDYSWDAIYERRLEPFLTGKRIPPIPETPL